jgi:hypothetical protein
LRWSCVPNKQQACQSDGHSVMQLEANVSRLDVRSKTGADEKPEAANPVLLGEDNLCDRVSCPPGEKSHSWHLFEQERREWHAEQIQRAWLQM